MLKITCSKLVILYLPSQRMYHNVSRLMHWISVTSHDDNSPVRSIQVGHFNSIIETIVLSPVHLIGQPVHSKASRGKEVVVNKNSLVGTLVVVWWVGVGRNIAVLSI